MAKISLAVNDVNIVKGIIVITLKKQIDFESIYLKHRKNDEKIACDYNVLDNKTRIIHQDKQRPAETAS